MPARFKTYRLSVGLGPIALDRHSNGGRPFKVLIDAGHHGGRLPSFREAVTQEPHGFDYAGRAAKPKKWLWL